jgi:hypothetical protein
MRRALTVGVLVLTVTSVLAACGGSGSDDPAAGREPDTQPAQGAAAFVGLEISQAGERADDKGRPWRVAREDDELFALTQDFVVGRVTFEVDDGVVTSASIEGDTGASSPAPPG